MERLIVLDYASNSVLLIQLTKDDVKNLIESKFDCESWIVENRIDKKFGFDVDNSHYMLSDDMLSIYDCNTDGEMNHVYLNH